MELSEIHRKVKNLRGDIEKYRAIWLMTAKADGGAAFSLDMLSTAATHRAMCLIEGFCFTFEKENFICAAPLIRLMLDTLLRFYAVWLVDNPHELALAILEGKELRKLKDREGNKMLDSYLVNKLSAEYSWIKRVYRETSGYIHLSNKHYFNTLREVHDDTRSITVAIGPSDTSIAIEIWDEAIDAMQAISESLLRYLHGWAHTKETAKIATTYGNRPDSRSD